MLAVFVLFGAGCTLASHTATSPSGSVTPASTSDSRAEQAQHGWLHAEPGLVIFVQWTEVAGHIEGQYQQYASNSKFTFNAAIKGSVSGNGVSLTMSALGLSQTLTGTISGQEMTLVVPQPSGSLGTQEFAKSSVADYNTVVAAQQRQQADADSFADAALKDAICGGGSLQATGHDALVVFRGSNSQGNCREWLATMPAASWQRADAGTSPRVSPVCGANSAGLVVLDSGSQQIGVAVCKYLSSRYGSDFRDLSGVFSDAAVLTDRVAALKRATTDLGTYPRRFSEALTAYYGDLADMNTAYSEERAAVNTRDTGCYWLSTATYKRGSVSYYLGNMKYHDGNLQSLFQTYRQAQSSTLATISGIGEVRGRIVNAVATLNDQMPRPTIDAAAIEAALRTANAGVSDGTAALNDAVKKGQSLMAQAGQLDSTAETFVRSLHCP